MLESQRLPRSSLSLLLKRQKELRRHNRTIYHTYSIIALSTTFLKVTLFFTIFACTLRMNLGGGWGWRGKLWHGNYGMETMVSRFGANKFVVGVSIASKDSWIG